MVAINVPCETFEESAKSLDKTTLRQFQQDSQRMFTSLTGYRLEDTGDVTHSVVDGWSHTPSVVMWSGYVHEFYRYAQLICDEWYSRDYGKSTVADKLNELYMVWVSTPHASQQFMADPPWLQDDIFLSSQKSTLIRKSVVHYSSIWPDTPRDLAPLWPVNYADGTYKLRVSTIDQFAIDRARLKVPDGTERAPMPPGHDSDLRVRL